MDPSMAEMIQTTTNMMGNMIWLMVVMLLIGITISVLTRIINEPVPPTPSPVVKPKKYVKKPVVRYDDVAEYKCPYCGTVRIMDEHADTWTSTASGAGRPVVTRTTTSSSEKSPEDSTTKWCQCRSHYRLRRRLRNRTIMFRRATRQKCLKHCKKTHK
jgi:hypothetical protein